MKKPLAVLALLLLPLAFVLAGFYFDKALLSSIGYIILIFYIILFLRGKFISQQEKES